MRKVWQTVYARREHCETRAAATSVPGLQIERRREGVYTLLCEDGSKKLVFERLREALDAILDTAAPEGIAAGLMHEAVVEARTSLDQMREQIARTEQRLNREREQLRDAERRRKLAEGIEDWETVEIAKRFAAKHSEHVSVLERKLEAQQAEAKLAQEEFSQMRQQLKQIRQKTMGADATARVEAAWRDIERAGGVRPDLDLERDQLRSQLDAATKESVADEQLRQLKKKMGR